MKGKSLRIAVPVLAIFGAVLILSCAEHVVVTGSGSPTGEVPAGQKEISVEQTGIFIPGSAVSEETRRAMEAALARYDKLLYKVETYRDGKLVQSNGDLPDKLIVNAAQIRRDAKLNRLTGVALQIGLHIGTHFKTSTPSPGASIGNRYATPTPHPGKFIGTRHAQLAADGGGGHFETPEPGFPVGNRYQSSIATANDFIDAEKLVKRLKSIVNE